MSGISEKVGDAVETVTQKLRKLGPDLKGQQKRTAEGGRDMKTKGQELDTKLADSQSTWEGKPLHKPAEGDTSGVVVVYDPKSGATPEQSAQVRAYVDGCNDALAAGHISPTGRVSTTGKLRNEASTAAAQERVGGTYTGHAGHVPDTTWTGRSDPHSWLDLDSKVNQSIGSQALRYPTGYKPEVFEYGGPYPQ